MNGAGVHKTGYEDRFASRCFKKLLEMYWRIHQSWERKIYEFPILVQFLLTGWKKDCIFSSWSSPSFLYVSPLENFLLKVQLGKYIDSNFTWTFARCIVSIYKTVCSLSLKKIIIETILDGKAPSPVSSHASKKKEKITDLKNLLLRALSFLPPNESIDQLCLWISLNG